MTTTAELLELAGRHHQAGNYAEAVLLYRRVLETHAVEAYTLPLFGVVLHNLGLALAQQGRFEEALASYQEAQRLRPELAEIFHNLGNLHTHMGQFAQAEASYREALRLRPDHPDSYNNVGSAVAQQGRLDEALSCLQEALRLRPDHPEAHYNVGIVLKQMGRLQEAEASFREALRLWPNHAAARNNLAITLEDQGRHEEAVASYREALRLRPDFPLAHYNLGIALSAWGKHDEAVASYEEAVRLKPDYADALNNLGNAYKDQGRHAEGVLYLRKAVAANPAFQPFQSNLLFALHYSADYDPETIFAAHRRWAGQFGASSAARRPPHALDHDPGRRLRIGYVSGDFREHVMGRYSEAVIGAHDRGQFEIFCYANVARPDAATQRLQASADHWRSIWGVADGQVAEQIRQDRIDLLVDLAGHTADNRLGVFAGRPAPVQVTHCGYPATTGLTSVDYRLTDPYCDPPGQTERWYTETLVRLPEGHWCFAPPSGPEVGPLPALTAGHVTFGSFNILGKITEPMIGLWARVLKSLSGSQMVIKTARGSAADERVRAAFARHGIGTGRVTLLGYQRDYFGLYQRVDICLDTYPYTGCNVTGDSLWMGVPVVSLAGPSCVTRQGNAALVQAGLDDLITETPEAYVEAAVRLAQDRSRLEHLRGQLRERVERSVGNVPRFTRHLEAAYRDMWERFCQGGG